MRSSIQRAGFAAVVTVMAVAAAGTIEADGMGRGLVIADEQLVAVSEALDSGLCAFAIAMCSSQSAWAVQEASK